MSKFDETTNRKASHLKGRTGAGFISGRNSVKESLEIMAKELVKFSKEFRGLGGGFAADEAINKVKARGDWPLGET